jgi:hypothetical protein
MQLLQHKDSIQKKREERRLYTREGEAADAKKKQANDRAKNEQHEDEKKAEQKSGGNSSKLT